jgi:hypothetical protein
VTAGYVITILTIAFAFTSFAQEPNKAEAIKAIEQSIEGRFIQETGSIDKQTVRWEFLDGACHGLPVIVDLVAYPTPEQVKAASIAAFSQAEYDYMWIMNKDHKLTGAEPAAETAQQYLLRQRRGHEAGH